MPGWKKGRTSRNLLMMQEVSYIFSAISFAALMISWVAFATVFLGRKKPESAPDAVNAPRSWVGIVLQGLAYLPVWSLQRRPFLSPFIGEFYLLNIGIQITGALLAFASVWLSITALRELGKQWSLEARLVEGHDLVTSGPYGLVRHPIYTAMLGLLIATGVVLSHWPVVIVAVVVFLIGTFIRTRFEERLLSDAFGGKFAKWKSRVPGLIPFVKL